MNEKMWNALEAQEEVKALEDAVAYSMLVFYRGDHEHPETTYQQTLEGVERARKRLLDTVDYIIG